MCISMKHRFARTAIATLLAGAAASGQAAVGAKVIVQSWEPWNDNHQTAVVPLNDPEFISRAALDGWKGVQAPICDAIKREIGRPDLVAPGLTLYDISCQFNPADVRLHAVSQSRAKLVVLLPQSRLFATATIPELGQLGADAPLVGSLPVVPGPDPRASVTLDVQLELDIEIGDAPRPFLTVHRARLAVTRADARGDNVSGKLAEWVIGKVIPFFGGPNFERMVERTLESLGSDFTARIQQALNPVNARLAPYAQYVRVATWISGSRIAVAFQPRSLPAIQFGGEMRGVLRDGRVAGGQPGQAVDCAGLRVSAEYQAAPRPIVNPDTLALGEPKMMPVGSLATQRLPDGSCSYALRGLAWAVTNYTKASHSAERRGSGSLIRMSTVLRPEGWTGARVNPRPIETNRNYVLATDLRGEVGVVERDPRRTKIDPVIADPRLRFVTPNPALSSLRSPGAVRPIELVQQTLDRPIQQASAAAVGIRTTAVNPSAHALNPQPLPPKTPVLAVQSTKQGAAATAVIRTTAVNPTTQSLNPQPLPPKTPVLAVQSTKQGSAATAVIRTTAVHPTTQSLNPQPLPPKTPILAVQTAQKASAGIAAIRTTVAPNPTAQALNPQPLPPRAPIAEIEPRQQMKMNSGRAAAIGAIAGPPALYLR
jgi:hypothetical protein